jgi:hypothetical protein
VQLRLPGSLCRKYKKKYGDLDRDRRSWLHIDYLLDSLLEEHGLWVIELAIVDSNVMVLIAKNAKAEPSVYRISSGPFRADIILI